MHGELAPGIFGGVDGPLQRRANRCEPARRIETDSVTDSSTGTLAEAQQFVVEVRKPRRETLGRRRRRDTGSRKQSANALEQRLMTIPGGAALRDPIEQQQCAWRADIDAVSAHHRLFKGFKRCDQAHADMPIAIARRVSDRIKRPKHAYAEEHQQQHGKHRHARANGESEQRRCARFSHERLPGG